MNNTMKVTLVWAALLIINVINAMAYGGSIKLLWGIIAAFIVVYIIMWVAYRIEEGKSNPQYYYPDESKVIKTDYEGINGEGLYIQKVNSEPKRK